MSEQKKPKWRKRLDFVAPEFGEVVYWHAARTHWWSARRRGTYGIGEGERVIILTQEWDGGDDPTGPETDGTCSTIGREK
jgi:hypothetical protein